MKRKMFLNGAIIALNSTDGNDGGGAGSSPIATGDKPIVGTDTGDEKTVKETKTVTPEEGIQEKINEAVKQAMLSKDQEINGLKSKLQAEEASKESKTRTLEEREAAAQQREAEANAKILGAHRDSEAANSGIPKYLFEEISITANDNEETISTKVSAFKTKLETYLNEKIEGMMSDKLLFKAGDEKANTGPEPGALGRSLVTNNNTAASNMAGNIFGVKR